MNNKIILGAFFGDEGKGQVVNNLIKSSNSLVVRFSGGHQVGHTVRHGGIEHIFSNFGSGTLKGIPTYWSRFCTVDPMTTMLEQTKLEKLGIIPKIIYSPFCEIVTPYDVISQWNDDVNLRHGSVGTGYFPTLKRARAGYHLTIADAFNPLVLKAKLEAIRDNYYVELSEEDTVTYALDRWVAETHAFFSMHEVTERPEYDFQTNIIFEGSQGILLDQTYGIMPYCTPSNTTCKNALELCKEWGMSAPVSALVTRPYITRHGNGPIPSQSPVIENFVDPNNKFNEFQKTIRAVQMDLNLLATSVFINTLNGGSNYPELIVTHADELVDSTLNDNYDKLFSRLMVYHFEELV